MSLNVYTASAGAGKTYAITETFLRLVLTEESAYSRILAVTFTNLATLEMKERFLKELSDLSCQDRPSPYRETLKKALKLSDSTLTQRAGRVLQNVLFDFSQLRVKTIDSFFQDVIRSLSLELGLPSFLKIETSSELILSEAVDRLLFARNAQVKKYILDYLSKRTEEEEGDSKTLGGLRQSLNVLALQLLREDVRLAFIEDTFPSLVELQNFEKNIYKEIKVLEADLGKLTSSFIRIDRDSLLPFLKGKSRNPIYSLHTKLSQKSRITGEKPFTDRAAENYQDMRSTLLTGDLSPLLSKESSPTPELEMATSLYCQIMDWFTSSHGYGFFLTLQMSLKHLAEMGLLRSLSETVDEIKRERQIMFIDNAKEIIRRIIGKDSVPFLYERMGAHIEHHMIDEFQDTSRFQYDNFVPLLNNALASGNESMIVGDTKQSIYLFRNSDPSILQRSLAVDFKQDYCPTTLQYNWRSCPAIVEFNNYIFSLLPKLLDATVGANGQLCQETFTNHCQLVPTQNLQNPGAVYLHRYASLDTEAEEGEQLDEAKKVPSLFSEATAHMVEVVLSLLKRGYKAGDIAILAPSKKELKAVANELMAARQTVPEELAEQLNFVSEDLLTLLNCSVFRLIVNVLKAIEQYTDTHPHNYYTSVAVEQWQILCSSLQSDWGEDSEAFVEQIFSFAAMAAQVALYDLVKRIVSFLNPIIQDEDVPYLVALLDIVHDFEKENTADLQGFLSWMERNPGALLLSGKVENSISLLTIHKSKGLGFKVVLVAGMSLKTIDGKDLLWLSLPEELKPLYSKEKDTSIKIPVNPDKNVVNTLFVDSYIEESSRNLSDRLNTFYVACTRAKEELHIWVPQTPPRGYNPTIQKAFDKAISHLFRDTDNLLSQEHTHQILRPISSETLRIRDEFLMESTVGLSDATTTTKTGFIVTDTFSYGQVPAEITAREEVAHSGDNFSFRKEQFLARSGFSSLQIKLKPLHSYREKRSIVFGEVIHEILSRVQWIDDLSSAVKMAVLSGRLETSQAQQIENRLTNILQSPPVQRFYTDDKRWIVFNERSILLPGGDGGDVGKLRPDRMQQNKETGEVVVIDYKTGTPHSSHKKQVTDYCRLLQRCGYSAVCGFLLYIDIEEDAISSSWSPVFSLGVPCD